MENFSELWMCNYVDNATINDGKEVLDGVTNSFCTKKTFAFSQQNWMRICFACGNVTGHIL